MKLHNLVYIHVILSLNRDISSKYVYYFVLSSSYSMIHISFVTSYRGIEATSYVWKLSRKMHHGFFANSDKAMTTTTGIGLELIHEGGLEQCAQIYYLISIKWLLSIDEGLIRKVRQRRLSILNVLTRERSMHYNLLPLFSTYSRTAFLAIKVHKCRCQRDVSSPVPDPTKARPPQPKQWPLLESSIAAKRPTILALSILRP